MKQILKLIRRRIGRAYSAFAGIVRNLAQSGTVAFKISLKLPLLFRAELSITSSWKPKSSGQPPLPGAGNGPRWLMVYRQLPTPLQSFSARRQIPKSGHAFWLVVYIASWLGLNRAMSTQRNIAVNNNDPSGVVDVVCAF